MILYFIKDELHSWTVADPTQRSQHFKNVLERKSQNLIQINCQVYFETIRVKL